MQHLSTDNATLAQRAINWTEAGLIPDRAVRAGIRRLLVKRLAEIGAGDAENSLEAVETFIDAMREAPIAPVPALANEQHYEVPAAFFEQVLGPHQKYSCCYWPADVPTLEQAETAALEATIARAGVNDGMRVLDLGCGWGSMSLFLAERFRNATVTAVSNSHGQRSFIEEQARRRGLSNVEVLTRDMNAFEPAGRYDRVVSVEMFEHMRNYPELFKRIARWLAPGGRFLMHIFCHRACPYAFEDQGPGDWMSRHFFSGGIMPSLELPLRFQRDLELERRWVWSGRHYQKTADAWLANLDARKDAVMPILANTYGPERARQWFMRWRIFFMACSELFGYANGQEWMVAHYRFAPADECPRTTQGGHLT